ncbi:DUF6918 family protein [Lyngbya confervoides]|uniref:Uncharacterized protein n=1 Tax=Lyngbya confervoides BDU141951 TaxID=1574623 RepID=A0ABD4T6E4_9CYAN|nr:hypothetical protein [Lyngbya confervoides]MCM1984134.1 hypothetical protein [Lyngbya confervoides BDU141951]
MVLSEKFQDPQVQAQIAQDCAQLMDQQVARKTGLGGLAIKAAYTALKGIGPNYVPRAIHGLLPQALVAMDPMWQVGVQTGDPVAHLSQNPAQTAEILLSVTDNKIKNAQNKIVIATYKKVRNSVKGDVEQAVPGLAQIIAQYS